MALKRLAAHGLRMTLHFLFPQTCAHCRADLRLREENPLCRSCLDQISPLVPLPGLPPLSFSHPSLYCRRCGAPLPYGGAHCPACRGKNFYCSAIRAAFKFNPPIQALIHGLKYEGRTALAQHLGLWMAQAFRGYPELQQTQGLVPVPLHPNRRRERGFNQSELLAEILSREISVPVHHALEKTRPTPPQASLGRDQRIKNLQGAFRCVKPQQIAKRMVLLVDDVCTTGATLEECGRALRRAGAARVWALVVARQPGISGGFLPNSESAQ